MGHRAAASVGGQRHAACRRALASHAQPVAVILDNVTQPVGGERHQLAAARLVLEAMVMIGGFLPHDVAAVDAFAFAQLSGRLAIAAAIDEVFDRCARFIVSLRCGVLPAGRREGGDLK